MCYEQWKRSTPNQMRKQSHSSGENDIACQTKTHFEKNQILGENQDFKKMLIFQPHLGVPQEFLVPKHFTNDIHM